MEYNNNIGVVSNVCNKLKILGEFGPRETVLLSVINGERVGYDIFERKNRVIIVGIDFDDNDDIAVFISEYKMNKDEFKKINGRNSRINV